MAILENCEVWHPKLDPKNPNDRYNKTNPTWEIQIRTNDKAQVEDWRSKNIPVKPHRETEDGPVLYYRANLRKKSIKADGEDSSFVEVKDGDLKNVDPTSIGNGSIANIRVFQYEYKDAKTGKVGIANVLMGVQLTKHLVYVPKPREDDFKAGTKTEVVAAPITPMEDNDIGPDDDESGNDGVIVTAPVVTPTATQVDVPAAPAEDVF